MDFCHDEGGVVTSTDFFKYLGGGVDSALTDSRDVDKRIGSAAGAFGALRKAIFSSRHIKLRTKKAVHLAIVVNILLYGAECWCLTEELLDRLRVFHNQCVRAMCGVKLWHQWRHGIRNRELRRRLKMESLDQLGRGAQASLGGPRCAHGPRAAPAQVPDLVDP